MRAVAAGRFEGSRPGPAVGWTAGGQTELTVRQGFIWLTCEGRPEDVFLAAGEVWSVNGAARLHLNAENGQEALLEIRVRGG